MSVTADRIDLMHSGDTVYVILRGRDGAVTSCELTTRRDVDRLVAELRRRADETFGPVGDWADLTWPQKRLRCAKLGSEL